MVMRKSVSIFAGLLPFLVSFYLVFRIYAINALEVSIGEFFVMLLIYLTLCLVVYLPLRLVFKDVIKSSLLASTVMLLNGTYGLSKYIVWGIGIPVMTRFAMFVLTVIVGIIISYIIIKSKNLRAWLKFSYSFVLVLLLFSFIMLFSNVVLSAQSDPFNRESVDINKSEVFINPEDKCDVYYIIFDTYMGHKILKKYYGYDNRGFVRALRERGFYVAEDGRSNYTTTYVSMPATLNMEYMPDSVMYRKELMNRIWNNKVMELFSRLGYKTNTLNLGVYFPPVNHVDNHYRTIYTQFGEEVVLQTYTGEFVKRMIYEMNGSKRTPKAFEILHRIVNDEDLTFTYAHLMIPHAPYYFTPEGELYENVSMDWRPEKDDDRFIDQIKFVNKKILALVDSMLQCEPRPVIILQGDHGKEAESELPPTEYEIYDQELSILNAIYFPDEDYSLLNDTITSINTFLVFRKKFLDPSVELKEDISYKINLVNKYYYHILDISQYNLNAAHAEAGDFH